MTGNFSGSPGSGGQNNAFVTRVVLCSQVEEQGTTQGRVSEAPRDMGFGELKKPRSAMWSWGNHLMSLNRPTDMRDSLPENWMISPLEGVRRIQ